MKLGGYNYGTKEWFENKFKDLDQGDGWGHSFHYSQKYRMRLCLTILGRNMPVQDDYNILDIGCGACDFTHLVHKINTKNKIFATDISENAVSYNSRNFLDFEHSVQKLPVLNLPDSHFDLIMALEVVNYLTKIERVEAMISIKSKLKVSGQFLFSTVISDDPRYFTEVEALDLLKKHFKISEVHYNHSKLWEYFEYNPVGLLNLYSIYSKGKISEILYLTNNLVLRRILTNKRFISFVFPLINILSLPSKSFLKSKLLFSLVNTFSRFIFPNSGKSHIIILANKTD